LPVEHAHAKYCLQFDLLSVDDTACERYREGIMTYGDESSREEKGCYEGQSFHRCIISTTRSSHLGI
jgi:hypothetical protein